MAIRGTLPAGTKNDLASVVPIETPYTVMISPTDYCNLKCIFCEYHGNRKNIVDLKQEMSVALYKNIIDQLAEFSSKIKLLIFDDYGEPTLNKNLPDMISYAKEKNVAQTIRLVTNGTTLCHDLNQRLIKSGLDQIKISIEAISSEEYYRIAGVKMDVDHLISNIKDLYKSKGKMDIYCKIVDIALGGTGGTEPDAGLVAKFYSMFDDICDYCNIENVIPHSTHINQEMLCSMGIENFKDKSIYGQPLDLDKHVCAHLLYYLSITPNGDVYPCSRGKRSGYLLGNVQSKNLVEIWNSNYLRDLRIDNILGNNRICQSCQDCEFIRYTNFPNLEQDKDILYRRLMNL